MRDDVQHRIKIVYECGEVRNEMDAVTYVAVTPVAQPWQTGRPWNLTLRDAVYEAADMLIESLARDMKTRPTK